ncbi:effector-associated domain 2-containing protein [Streptomyces sp. MAR4 CNX-425]|uniref:VMAP-C domain-containing protein n=1 Tax=Streptomyces sp. MAR4 CNX-425 TaxID=3406343 RepID=UPI003B50F817
MVDVLQEAETMRRPASMEMVLQAVAAELQTPLEPPRPDQPLRVWLLRLVGICADVDEGLQGLARCLGYVEQQSVLMDELARLLDEWEAAVFFRFDDLHPLRPVLQKLPSDALLTLARRASHSRTQELEAWCKTGWDVFLRLAGDNTTEDELPPCLAYLDLAADLLVEEGRHGEAEELRRWARRQSRARGLLDVQADWAATKQRVRTSPSAEPSLHPAYLLIQCEPDGVDPDRFYLSHWRQADADGWHPVPGETLNVRRNDLEVEVERLVEQAEARWADLRQPVVIEFILPWELLREPVEWWNKESDARQPTPLVMYYTVVLRSLDRLRKPWYRPWNNRWRQLRDTPAESRSHWSRPGQSAFHLERELQEDDQIVCLVLNEVPGSDSETAQDEFTAALRAGIPAMLWQRGASDPAFREAAADILQERSLAGLLERTRVWRRQALSLGRENWDGHVGRHLAVLLDDPERIPGPSSRPDTGGPDRRR